MGSYINTASCNDGFEHIKLYQATCNGNRGLSVYKIKLKIYKPRKYNYYLYYLFSNICLKNIILVDKF